MSTPLLPQRDWDQRHQFEVLLLLWSAARSLPPVAFSSIRPPYWWHS